MSYDLDDIRGAVRYNDTQMDNGRDMLDLVAELGWDWNTIQHVAFQRALRLMMKLMGTEHTEENANMMLLTNAVEVAHLSVMFVDGFMAASATHQGKHAPITEDERRKMEGF